MDEIAAQLGVSKKTLYQYYSDKDELVDLVAKEMIVYSQEHCDRMRGNSRDAIHEIFQAMDMIQEIFKNMNPSMLFDLERYHHATFQAFLDHKNKYLYGIIRNNLERGIAEGLYRSDIEVEIVTRFRIESMMIPFNPQFYSNGSVAMTDVHQQIVELFVFGVASPQGYKLILKYQQERQKSKQL